MENEEKTKIEEDFDDNSGESNDLGIGKTELIKLEDLKEKLEDNTQAVNSLHKRIDSWWKIFFFGVLRGAGTIIGIIAIVIFLGWILDVAGIIGFREFSEESQIFINRLIR